MHVNVCTGALLEKMTSSVGINHKSLPDLPELYMGNYYDYELFSLYSSLR